LVSVRHKKNDRPSGNPRIYPIANPYIPINSGNDPSAVDKIIECPPQIDINIWKY
jgi:hypothetical protein